MTAERKSSGMRGRIVSLVGLAVLAIGGIASGEVIQYSKPGGGGGPIAVSSASPLPVKQIGAITAALSGTGSMNLSQVGSVALTEGQKTKAASIPVVLPSDYTLPAYAATPTVNVGAALPTGANTIGAVNAGTGFPTPIPTAPVIGTKTNNSGAPSTNNLGTLPMVATASAPTYAEGNQTTGSVDLAGNQRIAMAQTLDKTNDSMSIGWRSRTYLTFTSQQVASVSSSALKSFNKNAAGTVTGSVTSYVVTSGKSFHIQSIMCEVRSTSATVAQFTTCSDANVAAWLNLNMASGNVTVPAGCSASGVVFTKTGSPTFLVAGPPGLIYGVTVSGSNYFRATTPATLDPSTSAMVIEAWIKSTSAASFNTIFTKGTSGGGGPDMTSGYGLAFASGKAEMETFNGVLCRARQTGRVDDGFPHYIRGTWNGSTTCTVNVDGGPTVTTVIASGTVDSSASDALIGRSASGSFMAGTIYMVRVTIGNATNNLTNAQATPGARATAVSRATAASRGTASARSAAQ